MRKIASAILILSVFGLLGFQTKLLYAGEHPGGTVEHPGTTAETPVQDTDVTATAQESEPEEGEDDPGETQEHAGEEHPGTTKLDQGDQDSGWVQLAKAQAAVIPPSAEDIRAAMDVYAKNDSRLKGGIFLLFDSKMQEVLSLEFIRVHERVGKLRTREGYFSCCDFKDSKSSRMYDVDFWMNDNLEITDVMVHKVDGKPRFTYDENDNQIQLE